ncbi:arylsulfatase [Halorubrum californiense DSM 19288]|uniref:Arylsulfatase n=2 Tax=Haloferacaceae TaxID=1644056 RepID=M0DYF3_9EURY|nr:arylsulfatase [Halorubrum californiense DSM 19288]
MMLSSGGQSEESIDWFLDPFKSDIAGSRGDTFLTVNLMTCHSPYVPPDEYRTVEPYTVDPFELTLRSDPVTDREHRRHVESYEACARYLDDALQTVIDIVDWDALFIVGDHGELFGEHGLRQHQYGVYEELIHVPTLAFGSEIPAGTTETLTSLVDIHATLLDLMDLSDAETGRGESLLSGDPIRDHVYAESVGNYRATPGASGFDEKIPRSWSDPHYMYATDDALFVSDKDGERVISTDWKEERPEYRDELQQAVAQLRSELPTTTSGATNRNVPESIESRLASLGYR